MATKFTYTEQELNEIIAKYTQGISLEAMATEYTKSVISIRMKLVKQGIYQKQTKTTKIKTASGDTDTKEKSDAIAMGLVGPALM